MVAQVEAFLKHVVTVRAIHRYIRWSWKLLQIGRKRGFSNQIIPDYFVEAIQASIWV
jgi:hypothetical protein